MSKSRTSFDDRMTGVPVVLSGPAGVGKTVVARRVASDDPRICLSVSATSRPQRPGEKEGEDYFFLSREEFERRLENGDLLEYAEHLGNLYGTLRRPLEEMLESGIDVLLTLDTIGGSALRKTYPGGIYVFLLPPSTEILAKRLWRRGRDPEDEMRRRLELVNEEMRRLVEYDYLVVNTDLEDTVRKVRSVIIAARLRKERNISSLVEAGIVPREILEEA